MDSAQIVGMERGKNSFCIEARAPEHVGRGTTMSAERAGAIGFGWWTVHGSVAWFCWRH